MHREEYINQQLLQLMQHRYMNILLLGAFLFLFLGVMDYYVTPENFNRFALLRSLIASALLGLLLFHHLSNRHHIKPMNHYIVLFLGIALSAVTIEMMILQLGGHRSSYYAGMNLLVFCVWGFVPLALTVSSVSMIMIYLIYLVPILLWDTITDTAAFVNNNAFLLSTFIIAGVWRALNQRELIRKFGLEYELSQRKAELESHSRELERLVAERTKDLNKSELILRSLFEQANDGIILMDRDGIILRANQRACEIHGFENKALVGTNIRLVEVEENRVIHEERMQRILAGEPLMFETEHYRRDGTKVQLEVSTRLVEIDGQAMIQSFHRDISERKKLQALLLHSQKMESLGQLAGGISHDFNNILAGILGFSELILLEENLPEGTLHKVKRIEQAARTGKQIVSKITSFARRSSFDRVLFNVNSTILDTLEMVSRLIPRDIRIQKDLLSEPPVIEGDVSQMEQVVMNLVLNARDAMPKGGDISIGTSIVELGPRDLRIAASIIPGKYALIAISDTGVGISEENLHRIFEPFFTTKDKGKGTGLGLAMVYGVVKEHRGYITVESRLNRGTTFKVYLPLSSRKMGAESKDATKEWIHGSETILVVDDEISVLEFTREALQRRGFNVLVTDNPINALSLYRNKPGKIDLVITDILMPLMSGTDLINELRSINTQIRVIATTGMSLDIGDVRVDGFIKKPITTNALLSEVCKTLGYPSRAGNEV